MNEIWRIGEDYCCYSKDREICRWLSKRRWAKWFGTYTKSGKWIAEQYQFPESKMDQIEEMVEVSGMDI